MGQSQGYGAPHYDDQSHQANSHHSGGSGGYQKNSGGGYRARNSHHNNNQYQNQYNPQHGGYGGQPYGMGYHGQGMTDPYAAMQQHQQHVGGFQEDDHQKGRKGRGNNSSLNQQFQNGPPQLGGQGQSFGLQGQQQQVGGIESAPSSGGWSNQAAGGGWSGSAAQSGGW